MYHGVGIELLESRRADLIPRSADVLRTYKKVRAPITFGAGLRVVQSQMADALEEAVLRRLDACANQPVRRVRRAGGRVDGVQRLNLIRAPLDTGAAQADDEDLGLAQEFCGFRS